MAELQDQPNIGDAIKKSIIESFKNLDPVSLMEKIVATAPEDEESEEIRKKLEGVLNNFNEMNDQEKEGFVNQMKEALASKISTKLGEQDLNLDGLQEVIGQAILYKLIFVGVLALVLLFLFVFFGYKLYKSIKDKELRKEEKKKAKQMKKKK